MTDTLLEGCQDHEGETWGHQGESLNTRGVDWLKSPGVR